MPGKNDFLHIFLVNFQWYCMSSVLAFLPRSICQGYNPHDNDYVVDLVAWDLLSKKYLAFVLIIKYLSIVQDDFGDLLHVPEISLQLHPLRRASSHSCQWDAGTYYRAYPIYIVGLELVSTLTTKEEILEFPDCIYCVYGELQLITFKNHVFYVEK